MSISFSGLASGLDTSSWVESLTALKRAKVNTLQEEKQTAQLTKETLDNIKSFFNSFRSMLEKVTDTKLFQGSSADIFSKNLAASSNVNILTATATNEAAEGTYNVVVNKVASQTEAASTFKKSVTETVVAGLDTKLTDIGVNISEIGNEIKVSVNGAQYGIDLNTNDTIATFINKLKDKGVEANYNTNTGIFSMNVGASDILDTQGTNIKTALHLQGVNAGYRSGTTLQTKTVEEAYQKNADNSTKLKDLGVETGNITFRTSTGNKNIAVTNSTTIGDFVQSLNDNGITASFTDGRFNVQDVEILTTGGSKGQSLIDSFNLGDSIFAKSQTSKLLTYNERIDTTTAADRNSKLSEFGEISNGSTVTVKNSAGQTKTITLNANSTIGDLFDAMETQAGMTGTIVNGQIELTGGTITGGTYDAVNNLYLTRTADPTTTTGNVLTTNITVSRAAEGSTKLTDIGVETGNVVFQTDSGNKNVTIDSNTTINSLVADLNTKGITASFTDGNLLIKDATIDTSTGKGASLIDKLNLAVSTSSTVQSGNALTFTANIESSYIANEGTYLRELGEISNGQTITVRNSAGENRTITLNTDSQISSLISGFEAAGMSASITDGVLEITGGTITGGTYDINDIFGLSNTPDPTTANGNVLSETLTVTQTADSSVKLTDLGAEAGTVTFNTASGSKTVTISNLTSIADLVSELKDNQGIDASYNNGTFTINNATIDTSTGKGEALVEALNLVNVPNSSEQTGTALQYSTDVTTISAANSSTKLSELGNISNGQTVTIKGSTGATKTITLNANSTIGDLVSGINGFDGMSADITDGTVSITGGTITGGTYDATAKLGLTSSANPTTMSGATLTTSVTTEYDATVDTLLVDLGVTEGYFKITTANGQEYTEEIYSGMSIYDLIGDLNGYGANASFDSTNKTLRISGCALSNAESNQSNFINKMFGDYYDPDIISTSVTSPVLKYTQTTTELASESTTMADLGVSDGSITIQTDDGSASKTLNITGATTVQGLVNLMNTNGITASFNEDTGRISFNGKVVADSTNLSYVLGTTQIRSSNVYTGNLYTTEERSEYTLATERIKDSLGNDIQFSGANKLIFHYSDVTLDGELNGTDGPVELFTAGKDYVTIDDIVNEINDNTFYSASDGYGYATYTNGVLTIEGGWIESTNGKLEEALGLTTHMNATKVTSSDVITYTGSANASLTSKLCDIVDASYTATETEITFKSADGTVIGTNNSLTWNSTIGDFVNVLNSNGYTASYNAGTGKISITPVSANAYAEGNIIDALGLTKTSSGSVERSEGLTVVGHNDLGETVTVGKEMVSLEPISLTKTVYVDESTKLSEIISGKINGTITAEGVTGTVIGIGSKQDLINLRDFVNNGGDTTGLTFIQTADINLSGEDWCGIGGEYGNAGEIAFSGIYDGGGYRILNLTTNTTWAVDLGLFGYTDGAVIKNITLSGINIKDNNLGTGSDSIGTIVGRAHNSEISGCKTSGSMDVCYFDDSVRVHVGGICGIIDNTNIQDCSSSVSINCDYDTDSYSCIGGIVGMVGSSGGTISRVRYDGSITGGSFNGYVGGIIGYTGYLNSYFTATITDAIFSGNIDDISSPYYGTAGIVGSAYNDGGAHGRVELSRCIVNGGVNSFCFIGACDEYDALLYNCYSTSDLSMTANYDVNDESTTCQADVGSSLAMCTLMRNNWGTDTIAENGWSIGVGISSDGYNLTIGNDYKCILKTSYGSDVNTMEWDNFNSNSTIEDLQASLEYTYSINIASDGTIGFTNENGGTYFSQLGLYNAIGGSEVGLDGSGSTRPELTETATMADLGMTNSYGLLTVKDDVLGTIQYVRINKTDTVEEALDKISAAGFTYDFDLEGHLILDSMHNEYLDFSGDLGQDAYEIRHALNLTVDSKQERATTIGDLYKNATRNQSADVGNTYLTFHNGDYCILRQNYTVTEFKNTLESQGINLTIDEENGRWIYTPVDPYDNYFDGGAWGDLSKCYTALGITALGNGYSYTTGSYTTYTNNSGQSNTLTDHNVTYNTTGTTTLGTIGVTGGTLIVNGNGKYAEISISTSDTINDLIGKLDAIAELNATFHDGKITIVGEGEFYISSSSTSNIASVLGWGNANWQNCGTVQTSEIQTSDYQYNIKADGNTKLVELNNNSGDSLGITAGTFYVDKNGEKHLINITNQTTVNDLAAALTPYGVTTTIDSQGVLRFVSDGDLSFTTTGIASGASNILTQIGTVGLTNNKAYTTSSERLTTTSTNNVLINSDNSNDVKLTELKNSSGTSLGITTGSFYVYENGVRYVENITADTTVAGLKSILESHGLTVGFANGELTVSGSGNSYVESSGGSNIVTKLFDDTQYTYSQTSVPLSYTRSVGQAITNDTKISDITGTALTDGNFSVVDGNGNVLTPISVDENTTIGSLREILESQPYGFTTTLTSSGQLIVYSADGKQLKSLGGGSNVLTKLGIETQNATRTYSSDTINISNTEHDVIIKAAPDTLLSNLGVTQGEFYIYNNGVQYTSYIGEGDTIESLLGKFQTFGVSAALIDNGGNKYIKVAGNGYSGAVASEAVGASNVVSQLFGADTISVTNGQTSNNVVENTTNTPQAINESTKISDINGYTLVNGNFNVVDANGTTHTVAVNSDTTVGQLMNTLSEVYDFNCSLSGGQLIVHSDEGKALKNILGGTNALSILGVETQNTTRTYNTSQIVVDNSHTEVQKATESTTLAELGVSTGSFSVYVDGVKNTAYVSEGETVGSFINKLNGMGLQAGLVDIDSNRILRIAGNGDSYIEQATGENTSNVVTQLFGVDSITTKDKYNNTAPIMYDVTTNENVNENTKIKNIYGSTLIAGNFNIIDSDGTTTNVIPIGEETTIGQLMSTLNSFGFGTTLQGGQLIVHSEEGRSLKSIPEGTNALSILGIETQSVTSSYESTPLSVTHTNYQDSPINLDLDLSELGITSGEFYVYSNGVKNTAYVSEGDKVRDLLDSIKTFGVQAGLVTEAGNTYIKVNGNGNSYVAESDAINKSNVINTLFSTGTSSEIYRYEGVPQVTVPENIIIENATEESKISEIAKAFGLSESAADGTIVAKVNGVENVISVSQNDTVGDVLDRFRQIGIGATIADGKITLASGYNNLEIDSIHSTSLLGKSGNNFSLESQADLGGYVMSSDTIDHEVTRIENISVSNYANAETKLSLLNISEGSLTVYSDGNRIRLENVNSDWSFQELENEINNAFRNTYGVEYNNDINLEFNDGYLAFTSNSGKKIEVGATTDSCNFSSITGVQSGEDGIVRSARELYRINSSSKVTQDGAFRLGNVTIGTFRVGDTEFTIDENTTIADIATMISNNEGANASAWWDNITGEFIIRSKTTGASYVNIEAGTSNFTDIMGFTSEGKMLIDSQQIGDNAKFTINGTSYTSTSNNISSDVSRIKGVTLNLKGLSEGETVTLKIEKDKEAVADSIAEVVDAYNELITNVDNQISATGKLHKETTLKYIRDNLRNMMTSGSLSKIGIKVPTATAGNINTDASSIATLLFDKESFMQEYTKDPSYVRNLLVGDELSDGIFAQVENYLENTVLKGITGYFDVTSKSYSSKITNLDTKIANQNKALERYKAQLEKKFKSMDMIISKMNDQYRSFLAA